MKETSPRLQWRAFTTALVAFSFAMLLASGIVLFLSPPGRVANWTDWAILRLRKSEWTGLHVWFGAVFLVVVAFHLFFNWRPLVSYFKDRLTRQVSFRREWLAAAVLSGGVAIGTLAKVPPFSSLLTWNEAIKASWEKPAERAPIPHAELLTLSELAEKGGTTAAVATLRLEARGVKGFTASTVVAQIAERAGLSAKQVYDIILTAPTAEGDPAHPSPGAGGGPGWKTLAQFCADESIPVAAAVARLTAKGFKVDEKLTLRELAQNNGLQKPYELLAIVRGK